MKWDSPVTLSAGLRPPAPFLDFAVLWKLGYALYRIFTRVESARLSTNQLKRARLLTFKYRISILIAFWLREVKAVNKSKMTFELRQVVCFVDGG